MIVSNTLLAAITPEIASGAYRRAQEQARHAPHPSSAQLHEYAAGELDRQAAHIVRKHLLFCEICTDTVAALLRIEAEIDATLAAAANSVPLTDRIVRWVSELWTPQLAGQPVTAEELSEQTQCFLMDEGDIEIACSWRAPVAEQPAYIGLRWRANLTTPGAFTARFVDPETNTLLAEVSLGADLVGEETLPVAILGFDPASQRWAISIAVTEI